MIEPQKGDRVSEVAYGLGDGTMISDDKVRFDDYSYWDESDFHRIGKSFEMKLISRAEQTLQIDYNDGKWHGWNGGECPVHPDTVVECFCSVDKEYYDQDRAYDFDWTTPGAFRVIKEHKDPREVTIDGVKYIEVME